MPNPVTALVKRARRLWARIRFTDDMFIHTTEGFYIYRMTESSELLFCSPYVKTVTGFSAQELMHDPEIWLRILHPDDLADYELHFSTPALRRTVFERQLRITHPDTGELRWLYVRHSPVFDKRGVLRFFDGLVMDITVQKRTELALTASEARHRTMIESARGFYLFRLTPENTMTLVSPSVEEIWGVTPEEFIRDTALFSKAVHPDDQMRVVAAEISARQTRQVTQVVFRVINQKTQRTHWMQNHNYITEVDGVVFIDGMSVDITEKYGIEQALRRSEETYRTLVNNTRGFFFFRIRLKDSGMFEFVMIGAEVLNVYGVTAEQMLADGKEAVRPVHPDDMERAMNLISTLVGPTFPTEMQVEFRIIHRKTQAVHWVELRVYHAGYESGRVFDGIVTDVTERHMMMDMLQAALDENNRLYEALEMRVQERTAQLAAKNKSLESFVYSVSHDLKTPLRGLMVYLDMLNNDYVMQLDERGQRYLTHLNKQSGLMMQLLEDLLSYSRAEQRTLRPQQVDVLELLRELRTEFLPYITESGALLTVDLGWTTLTADEIGLRQVMANLLSNALRFSKDRKPPLIGVTSWVEEGEKRLCIRDNGIGFDMRYHDRMFRLFERLNPGSGDSEGTGVGLAIVRKNMERMNGRVWAESEMEKGAAFSLAFPDR